MYPPTREAGLRYIFLALGFALFDRALHIEAGRWAAINEIPHPDFSLERFIASLIQIKAVSRRGPE